MMWCGRLSLMHLGDWLGGKGRSEKGKRKMLVLWSARAVSYLSKLSGLLQICCSILLLICTSSPATWIWLSLIDALQGQQYEPKLPWSLQFMMWTQSNHFRPLARFILHVTTKTDFHFTVSLNEMMEILCVVFRVTHIHTENHRIIEWFSWKRP